MATDAPEYRAAAPTPTPEAAPPVFPTRAGEQGLGSAVPSLARRRVGVRFSQAALPVAVALAVLLGIWQWYASQPSVDPELLPTPVAVWGALVGQRDLLWSNTLVTLWETLVGFGASLAAGVLFAVVIDFSPWPRRARYPLLVATQTIPIITLAPLLVLWFGFGLASKAIVVTLVCFFPI